VYIYGEANSAYIRWANSAYTQWGQQCTDFQRCNHTPNICKL